MPAANTQPEPRYVDAGADYLRLSPDVFDLYIARHRAISTAEISLAELIDELGSEMETEHLGRARKRLTSRAASQAPARQLYRRFRESHGQTLQRLMETPKKKGGSAAPAVGSLSGLGAERVDS
jgi:hypothetical protein